MAKRHVRPALIEVPSLGLNDQPRLGRRLESVQVQTLVAQRTVERRDGALNNKRHDAIVGLQRDLPNQPDVVFYLMLDRRQLLCHPR